MSVTVGQKASGFYGYAGKILNVQVFTSTSTYFPTRGMRYCIIEGCGSGAGGGGVPNNGADAAAGGGGGSGAFGKAFCSSAQIGPSQTVTIGAAGAGSSGNIGGAGNTSSVGSLFSQGGGAGGPVGFLSPTTTIVPGGLGGTASTATGGWASNGMPGDYGVYWNGLCIIGGKGGNSPYGGGGISPVALAGTTAVAGNNAGGYGAGGSGALIYTTASTKAGGNGTAGIIIITEFL